MAKRKSKLRPDANETAFNVVQAAVGEAEKLAPPEDRTEDDKNPTAVERGREGGKKGGVARAEKLTDDERAEIARIAATARWKKGKGSD